MLNRSKSRSAQRPKEMKKTAECRRQLDHAVARLCSLSEEEAAAMKEVNLFHWVCSMMKISGSLLSKARIGAMLDGSTVREATVEEYRYLRSCVELYLEFRHMVEFDIYLDEKYIRKIHGVLAGNPSSEYRRSNPVLRDMEYNPPHRSEIGELMKAACREIISDEHYEDRVGGAVRTHDMIMAVWPFEERNGETAYAAMSYELLTAGYPLPALDIDEKAHLTLAKEFVKSGASHQLYAAVVDNLFEQCGGMQLGL